MLGSLAVLSALQGLQAQTPGLSYPVPIDEAHFPDEEFRSYLLDSRTGIDKDKDGWLSVEECGCWYIDPSLRNYYEITSLEGIEYFYALTTLVCYGNQLTSLDVSGCTALTTLECYGNQLTRLDVSGCTALTTLECYGNQLTSLDVSKNTALTTLECYGNQLTHLDVSGCTALWTLDCSNNALLVLEVRSLFALQ